MLKKRGILVELFYYCDPRVWELNPLQIKEHSVYICGAEVMREKYIQGLIEKGVEIEDIHYEEFSFR